jgi:hypothetical protein
MAINHIVKQGEHVISIAAAYGFSHYRTIWNHPQNEELKKKRDNPNVLFPGDVLFIPENEEKTYRGETERRHVFVRQGHVLMLNLKLHRGFAQAIRNTACDIYVEYDCRSATTDEDGNLKQQIPDTAVDATLLIKDSEIVDGKRIPLEIEMPVKIGFLDPVEEISGQRARLANLGYYLGSAEEPDPAQFSSAVEEFQCDNSLFVDGICGEETQARLKQIHGC